MEKETELETILRNLIDGKKAIGHVMKISCPLTGQRGRYEHLSVTTPSRTTVTLIIDHKDDTRAVEVRQGKERVALSCAHMQDLLAIHQV